MRAFSGDLAFLVDMWNGQPNAGEAMVTGTGFTRHGPVVATHRVYDSFGDLVSETDASVALDFGFQGRAWDAGAGLAYHRARWVDPSVGRFISEDPIGLGDGPNRFRFAGNNPVNRTDPSGLAAARQSPGAFSADLSLQQVDFGFNLGGFVLGGGSSPSGGGPGGPSGGGFGAIAFDEIVSQAVGLPSIQQRFGLSNAELDRLTFGTDASLPLAQRAAIAANRTITLSAGQTQGLLPDSFLAMEAVRSGFDNRRIALDRDTLIEFSPDQPARALVPLEAARRAGGQPIIHSGVFLGTTPITAEAGDFQGFAISSQFSRLGDPSTLARSAVSDFDSRNLVQRSRTVVAAAEGLRDTLLGLIPGVGELQDLALALDPSAGFLTRTLAVGSLGLSVATAGTSPNFGAGARSVDDVVGQINRNADLAVEMARRAQARGRISGTPQAFGSRASRQFERLNNRLNLRLDAEGSRFRVVAEEFRDAEGFRTARNARGSIGSDVFILNIDNNSIVRNFDLKTFGDTPRLISPGRQMEFQNRLGLPAEEIFRQR